MEGHSLHVWQLQGAVSWDTSILLSMASHPLVGWTELLYKMAEVSQKGKGKSCKVSWNLHFCTWTTSLLAHSIGQTKSLGSPNSRHEQNPSLDWSSYTMYWPYFPVYSHVIGDAKTQFPLLILQIMKRMTWDTLLLSFRKMTTQIYQDYSWEWCFLESHEAHKHNWKLCPVQFHTNGHYSKSSTGWNISGHLDMILI